MKNFPYQNYPFYYYYLKGYHRQYVHGGDAMLLLKEQPILLGTTVLHQSEGHWPQQHQLLMVVQQSDFSWVWALESYR